MTKFTSPLNNIKVASPCSANWEEMYGNDRQRFCGECKLNVYNLSQMTKQDAENLIMNAEGRLCARFYRRADGTIITKDCPVGWAALKRNVSRVWTAAATVLLTTLSGIGITNYLTRQKPEYVEMGTMAIEKPVAVTPLGKPEIIMGDISPVEPESKFMMGRVAVLDE